jgi:outer membrane receptor for monomeric catechols
VISVAAPCRAAQPRSLVQSSRPPAEPLRRDHRQKSPGALREKSTLLDKRATLNFDIYDIEWKDIQVTVNNGGVNQLENAGNARVKGAELAFNYRIIPALSLGGSAAFTDAKLVTEARWRAPG